MRFWPSRLQFPFRLRSANETLLDSLGQSAHFEVRLPWQLRFFPCMIHRESNT